MAQESEREVRGTNLLSIIRTWTLSFPAKYPGQ